MKIRERIDYFLAKIAGEEVDLNDINPPVPVTTTEKLLDKIAEGGGGGTFSIGLNPQTGALDKTMQEIKDAIDADSICIASLNGAQGIMTWVGQSGDDGYAAQGILVGDSDAMVLTFVSDSLDGYPVYNGNATIDLTGGGSDGGSDPTDNIFKIYASQTDFDNGTQTTYYSDPQLSTGLRADDLVDELAGGKRLVISLVDANGALQEIAFPTSMAPNGYQIYTINSDGDSVLLMNYDMD